MLHPPESRPPPLSFASRGLLGSARKSKSQVLLENIGFDSLAKQLDSVSSCRDLLLVHFPRSNVTGRYLVVKSLESRTGIQFSPATLSALRVRLS
jgi:hypothetical protein